jgi:hypothetical protein
MEGDFNSTVERVKLSKYLLGPVSCGVPKCNHDAAKALHLYFHTKNQFTDGWLYVCDDHDVAYGLKPTRSFTVIED